MVNPQWTSCRFSLCRKGDLRPLKLIETTKEVTRSDEPSCPREEVLFSPIDHSIATSMVKAAKLFPCLQGPFANHIIVMRAIQHAIAGRNGVGRAAGGDALSAKPWSWVGSGKDWWRVGKGSNIPKNGEPARTLVSKLNVDQLKICLYQAWGASQDYPLVN